MNGLHDLFKANHTIVLFGYGLVFFIMGLAIALQSRRYSRLDLARNLSWLAGFGILHGLQEWGDLFIPIQMKYLSPPLIQMLGAGQLLLLAVSFICLFEFGISLLVSQGWPSRLHFIAPILLVAWILSAYYITLPLASDLLSWYRTASALARYFICLPGGLLAAFGLWRETRERVNVFNAPMIARTFGVTSVALGLYALFGGLIPGSVLFFPGNILNSATFEDWVGVPPLVLRSVIGLVLAISVIRGLDIFEIEVTRMVDEMEEQQILAAERERLARELHDGTIQTVYTAGLLVESARKLLPTEGPATDRLLQAEGLLNNTILALRQSLVGLHEPVSCLSLRQVLQEVIHDPRYQALVKVSLDMDDGADEFRPDQINHIRSIVVEALSNVVRHARAHHIRVTVQCLKNELWLEISDDGKGIREQPSHGYGLRNMRDRARILGGNLAVESRYGKGTQVQLRIPREENHG